jgi:hypothetical protein
MSDNNQNVSSNTAPVSLNEKFSIPRGKKSTSIPESASDFKLIPWRNPDLCEPLYKALFKLAVTEQIHINKHGEKAKKWKLFIDKLFLQPEFAIYDKVSIAAVEGQFESYILYRSKHHGWLDNGGKTGNLSKNDGDLDDLDRHIKQILMDRETYDEQKKFKADIKIKVEDNEIAVLNKSLSNGAREKRKLLVLDSGSKSDTTGGDSSVSQRKAHKPSRFEPYEQTIISLLKDSPVKKNSQATNNGDFSKDIEDEVNVKISNLTSYEVCLAAGIHYDDNIDTKLKECDLFILANIYFLEGVAATSKDRAASCKKQFNDLGFTPLEVHKLYKLLDDMIKATVEENAKILSTSGVNSSLTEDTTVDL